jgi:hypothetical protein
VRTQAASCFRLNKDWIKQKITESVQLRDQIADEHASKSLSHQFTMSSQTRVAVSMPSNLGIEVGQKE